jgi:hypothetical protein
MFYLYMTTTGDAEEDEGVGVAEQVLEPWGDELSATALLALRKSLISLFNRIVDFCCDVRHTSEKEKNVLGKRGASEPVAVMVSTARGVLALWIAANGEEMASSMHPRLYQLEGWRSGFGLLQ